MMPIILTPATPGYSSGDPFIALGSTREAVPRGLEANLQYNGIILGDTSVVDRYRLLDIGGLGDADIRDARENNPSSHGETAFAAYYGGRTITLSGRIEAHNMGKLRDMQEALRTAFVDLQEGALTFLTGDSTKDHYVMCRKSAPLQMGELQKDFNFYRDFLVTLRASNPRFLSLAETMTTVQPNRVPNPGFETDIAGWTSASLTGDWAVTTALSRSLVWAGEGVASAYIKLTKAATATASTLHVTTTTGASGFAVIPNTVYEAFMDVNVLDAAVTGIQLRIGWYTAAGAFISYTTGTISTATGVQTLSVSGAAPATAARAAVNLLVSSSTSGDVFETYIDDVWMVKGDLISPGIYEINNLGNFHAEPRFRIYGELKSFVLYNDTTGEVFRLKSSMTVPAGTFIEVHSANRTMILSDGTNAFNYIDMSSDWPRIQPGNNQLRIGILSTGNDDNGRVEIFHRNTWM